MRATLKVLEWFALVVLPIAMIGLYFVSAIRQEYAFDFAQFWQGGRDVLDGVSPYPALESVQNLPNDGKDLGPHAIQDVFRFPYPAPAALAIAPLAALPFGLAAAVLTVLLLGASFGGMRLLGVRDWRCYAVVFSSTLLLGAVTLGTLTPVLFFAVAVAWRYRDRWLIAGSALAGALVLKLFLWPVLVWLVATRRIRATGAAVAAAAVAMIGGWAVIGFAGFLDYPALLSTLSTAVHAKSLSITALAIMLGLSETAAAVVAWSVGAVLLGAVFVVARGPDGDRRALALSLAAALALSPIAWLHYYLLLIVPLALFRPRFGSLWLVPVLFWVTPFQENEGGLWRFGVVLGLSVLVFVPAVTGRSFRLRMPEPPTAPVRP